MSHINSEIPNRSHLSNRARIALTLAATSIAAAGVGGAVAVPKFLDRSKFGQTETISEIALTDSFTAVTKEEERTLWENTEIVNLSTKEFMLGFPVNQEGIDQSGIKIRTYHEPGLDFERNGDGKEINNVMQISGLRKGPVYLDYDSDKFDASIIDINTAGINKGGFIPAYTTIRVILREKATGKTFRTTMGVLKGKHLITPAPYPKTHPVLEDGTPITPDTPIIELPTDLQDWDGKGQVLPGDGGQVVFHTIGGGRDQIAEGVNRLSPVLLRTADGKIAVKSTPRQSMSFKNKDDSVITASWELPNS